ncbi:MAG: transketolase C-terminal domain-containing protein [Infirmifilum uzonense]|uniref:transketolase C-terminal domain-containing protein n=1 Tax=Infirmifilum uzonense TaxID=1550241 RepID=UPI003C7672EB
MSRLLLTGNYAAAYAVRDAEPDVISAYPITPQTPVIEKIADFIDGGELNAKFVRVESEHSAMAALIGAAGVGARTYTATSSQGLFYMYEVIWWASGARLPIVMGVVMRALGPPWSIWSEHTDFYALRDSGWNMLVASSAQEVYDFTLLSYRVAEDTSVLLPTVVGWDAFEVSHTYEPVELVEKSKVKGFLPAKGSWKPPLDAQDPASLGNLAYPEEYIRIRHEMRKATERALGVIEAALKHFSIVSGRQYSFFECRHCEDADTIFVVQGSIYGEVLKAVEELRSEGVKTGVMKLWLYRPFPYKAVSRALEGAKRVIVLARSSVFGSFSPLGADVSSAINLSSGDQKVFDVVLGVGGVDVKSSDIVSIYRMVASGGERTFWWVR